MAGWYRQGTVALTPGSAAVAGAGTMWMGVVRPGSAFTTDGRTLYEIREVANDHALTLDRPWEGETAAASAYAVIAASATLSNAELAGEIAAMVAKWAVREDQYDDWLGGSPNGGPHADGKYPLTDSKGVTRLVESPARLLQLLDDGVVEHAAQIVAAIEDDVATARQAAAAAAAAVATVSADRRAVAQAAATVAAQAGDSTAAAATATAQAAIAVHRADEAAGSAATAAGLEASATAALAAVETARDLVLEARTEAGTAATGALSARTAAEAARDTATAARDAALEARDAAAAARTQAQDWAAKTDAPVSGSLKSALSYALDAASQATAATGKAREAAGSAAAAAASAADLDTAAATAQAAAGDAATGAQTATAKAAAAALSADIARSAAQQAEAAGAGSATARTAAEAARDSAATAMAAAQVAASQAGQSQTNAANSAQTAATAAADAISAKSDATAARDLAVAARTEAQGARDLAQAFAQGAVGYQPSPGVYSAFHWSEQAKGHAQTAATIVGGSNFGIVGDGASQRFAADNPGSLLNLIQAPGGKLTFNPGNRAVSFGFDATTAPVAASGGITAGTVQGALEEIDHRLSTLSQDSIANGGGAVRVTADGTVEIAPAAGRPAIYKGGELHSSATAYGKAQTDAAIAAATNGLAAVARTGAYDDLLDKPDVYTRSETDSAIAAGQAAGAAKLTTPRTIAVSGGATGTATAFDGTANISIPVTALDATKLVGTIPIGNMPAAAVERLVPVVDRAARYALPPATIQIGDTVKEISTGKMFYLKDEANIGNAAGWEEYSVGTAAVANSAPWTGLTGRPALVDAIAALDSSDGVILQTSATTASKRAVGVASATDIPDRAAADSRYVQISNLATNALTQGDSSFAVSDSGTNGVAALTVDGVPVLKVGTIYSLNPAKGSPPNTALNLNTVALCAGKGNIRLYGAHGDDNAITPGQGGGVQFFGGAASAGSGASGGSINFTPGASDGTATGASSQMNGGASAGGMGGPTTVKGGGGVTGGPAYLLGGVGTAGPGGTVYITTPDSTGPDQNGAPIVVTTGMGTGTGGGGDWTASIAGKVSWTVTGTFKINGYTVWHSGNFDPTILTGAGVTLSAETDSTLAVKTTDAGYGARVLGRLGTRKTVSIHSDGVTIDAPDDAYTLAIAAETGEMRISGARSSNLARGPATAGGGVTVEGGQGASGARGGNLTLVGGTAADGTGGDVVIRGGLGTTAGRVLITSAADFSQTPTVNGIPLGGGNTISGTAPSFTFTETDAAANAKTWTKTVDGRVMTDTIVNDAGSSSTYWRQVSRSGLTVLNINHRANIHTLSNSGSFKQLFDVTTASAGFRITGAFVDATTYSFGTFDDTGTTLKAAYTINKDGTGAPTNFTFAVPALPKMMSVASASGTITLDFSYSEFFVPDLTGATVFGNPVTAPQPGQSGTIWIKQDATGNRTVSFGSSWKKLGSGSVNLTAGKETAIGWACRVGGTIHYWFLAEA